jgi:SAM-dependent methyltransferase
MAAGATGWRHRISHGSPLGVYAMSIWKSIEMRVVPRAARKLLNRGSVRYCPVCESDVRRFRSFGMPSRADAQCPVCYSLERHRLLWLYLRKHTDLFDGKPKKILHVAPEPQLSRLLCGLPHVEYVSADAADGKAMVVADVTRLPFADREFDVVFCNHVLEHVTDDRKAMSEFRRVLKPTGWAILQVPIRGETTFEDPSVTDPDERERLFGQWDHVRIYGTDYVDRLESAGFDVKVDPFVRSISESDARRMGLDRGEDIFCCR